MAATPTGQLARLERSESLERLESLAYGRELEAGCRELLTLLAAIERLRGALPAEWTAAAPGSAALPPHERERLVCNRIAAAASALLADPALQLAPDWRPRVLASQRWLAAIFEASDFGNADHVLRAIAARHAVAGAQVAVQPASLTQFCWLYLPQSQLPLDLGALAGHDRALACGLAVALLSPRLLATALAHDKRERLLPWLAANLDGIDSLDLLPADVLHDVYMHCSYAQRADKHDVKRAINRLVTRSLRGIGVVDTPAAALAQRAAAPGKPVMLVALEWFTSHHSIWRTHSLSIAAARANFEVVGIGLALCVDDTSRAIFDDYVTLPAGASTAQQLQQIQAEAERRQAQLLYMPSVGMFPLTMFLANVRVAPLQVMGLGHPATAHARAIDAAVVEDHYVGDPACFSEALLRLPVDGMPYRPLALESPVLAPTAAVTATTATTATEPPAVVQVALCAVAMKINPALLAACAQIAARARVPLHFHFLVGQARGLLVPPLRRAVRQALGDGATVWPEQPQADYRRVVARCDFFLNPFPFGNTNGTMDCVQAGLVGVCLSGREVHARIDEGMFQRLGWPAWLSAHSVDGYVAAAVRLAEQHDERRALASRLAGADKLAVFYAGRPEIMGGMLLQALRSRR